ncbi:hypothetical protein C7M84_005623 [Penaeus vannamei]|uniref:Uncharacterized protein n=1 Tax=Penaeus vannamei TaxID=6689 RepID=A0A423UAV8_PENVA|nr:hypothetical protein C7M84_005623 [Penaeus vannamei]
MARRRLLRFHHCKLSERRSLGEVTSVTSTQASACKFHMLYRPPLHRYRGRRRGWTEGASEGRRRSHTGVLRSLDLPATPWDPEGWAPRPGEGEGKGRGFQWENSSELALSDVTGSGLLCGVALLARPFHLPSLPHRSPFSLIPSPSTIPFLILLLPPFYLIPSPSTIPFLILLLLLPFYLIPSPSTIPFLILLLLPPFYLIPSPSTIPFLILLLLPPFYLIPSPSTIPFLILLLLPPFYLIPSPSTIPFLILLLLPPCYLIPSPYILFMLYSFPFSFSLPNHSLITFLPLFPLLFFPALPVPTPFISFQLPSLALLCIPVLLYFLLHHLPLPPSLPFPPLPFFSLSFFPSLHHHSSPPSLFSPPPCPLPLPFLPLFHHRRTCRPPWRSSYHAMR